MILTYKYRLKDRRAAKHLLRLSGACNQVWNWCVAQQRDIESRYRAGARPRTWLSGYELTTECRGVGRFLGIHQQTVQSVCNQFAESRRRIHHSPGFRRSFGKNRALGWIPFQAQSRQISGNTVTYLGRRYRWFKNTRRTLPETTKGGCFVEDARGRWYVCFWVDVPSNVLAPKASIGIDLGLKQFATMSDGVKIEAPHFYRRYERSLSIARRSRNKRRVCAINAKIANCRRDMLHKASTQIVRQNTVVAVGNVDSSKLSRSGLGKSVMDAGWSTFRNMLRYKCEHAGARYVEVDESLTTQACSECGSIAGPKGRAGLNKREWDCPHCGTHHDRDVNAARMILSRALSAQRPDEESREVQP